MKVDLDINALDESKLAVIDGFIQSIDEKEKELIKILHFSQNEYGYLPPALQLHIAREIGISAAKVNGVMSFYSYFTDKKTGENVISVCTGTACFVKGANDVLQEFKDKLEIDLGEISKDGLFTIKDVRCVGACGLAPVVVINEKVYGKVKVEDVDGIINEYRIKEDNDG